MIPGIGGFLIPQSDGIAQTVVFGGEGAGSAQTWRSTDGTTVSSVFSIGASSLKGLCYRAGTWVAFNSRYLYSSIDATTWTQRLDVTGGGAATPQFVIYGNNEFIARTDGSTPFYYSADGTSWSTSGSVAFNATALAWSSDLSLYVCVGASGSIITGTSAAGSWTGRTSGTGNLLRAVAYGNGKFVAVGNSGTIRYSTTGLTWSGATSGSTDSLSGVCWTGTYFIVCGLSGTLLRSSDGVTWSTLTSGTSNALWNVFANGSYVFVVGQNVVLRSTDYGASFSNFSSSVPGLTNLVYPTEGA
jgi:hypothetical protein